MGNDFEKGESVICINDHFPLIPEFSGNGDIVEKPKVGEILTVDEVLGDFLMFEKYNTETSTNWFFFNRFKRIDEENHKEHDEYYCRDLTPACDECLKGFEEWRKLQDKEYQDQLVVEN